jgi:DNA-binding IclR family transcriptional regulator
MRERLTQLTRGQDCALYELAIGEHLSSKTHMRTLKSLERAGLVIEDAAGWRLTRRGRREADKATLRIGRRTEDRQTPEPPQAA